MAGQMREQNLLSEQNPGDERRQFWRDHLELWATSGLSQAEYCRRNNLKATQFTYWKLKFNTEKLPIKFVQVPTAPVEPTLFLKGKSSPSLRLKVGTKFSVEIPDGFSTATLEQVLLILERV